MSEESVNKLIGSSGAPGVANLQLYGERLSEQQYPQGQQQRSISPSLNYHQNVKEERASKRRKSDSRKETERHYSEKSRKSRSRDRYQRTERSSRHRRTTKSRSPSRHSRRRRSHKSRSRERSSRRRSSRSPHRSHDKSRKEKSIDSRNFMAPGNSRDSNAPLVYQRESIGSPRHASVRQTQSYHRRRSPIKCPLPLSSEVMLRHLPLNADRDTINILIAKQGFHPIDIQILREGSDAGNARVFGFVEFSDSAQAQAWITYNNGHLIFDEGYKVKLEHGDLELKKRLQEEDEEKDRIRLDKERAALEKNLSELLEENGRLLESIKKHSQDVEVYPFLLELDEPTEAPM